MIKLIKWLWTEHKRTKKCPYYRCYKKRDKNGRFCAGIWRSKIVHCGLYRRELLDYCVNCPFRVQIKEEVYG